MLYIYNIYIYNIYIGFSWNREKQQTTMQYKKHSKRGIVTKPLIRTSHYFR